MSLSATGMPASGPASPRARIESAARAWPRLRSLSTVMNAFSSGFSFPTRSRNAPVSSTEEMRFAARAAESSASVASSTLLDHLRHEVQVVLHRRGDGLINRVPVLLGDFVAAQPLHYVNGMRHRLDAGGVDRAQLLHEGEDPVQPRQHRLGLLGPDRDAGQPGDAADLVVGKR